MEVKNINGTSNRKCNCCNSWKGHWEKITKQKAYSCSRKGCSNKADLGGHVMRTTDATWRIAPLCYECNKRDDWMELKKEYKLFRPIIFLANRTKFKTPYCQGIFR